MDKAEALTFVQKPARYSGGEYGAVIKDKNAVDMRVAFCFPDVYDVGMSHLGTRILYGLMNEMDGVWCERVFAPWPDMEAMMRDKGFKLYGLESGDSIDKFDVLAFTLQYELSYTNVLNMLDLAGLSLRADGREALTPLVIGGGPCAYNPEPVADFFDLFVIGEGEEAIEELLKLLKQFKKDNKGKKEFLNAAAKIKGVYVPSLYDVFYTEDGVIERVVPAEGAPEIVEKRVISDMDSAYFPTDIVVPSTEIVHDRVMLEIFRGCIRGCRFCQAGFTNRPVRAKSLETLVEQGIEACEKSGYQEISLLSLSTSDYRDLEPLCGELLEWCGPRRVSLSLPSLRADNFSIELMNKVRAVRKSGITFAPEAGTQRLRDAINKNITEEQLLDAVRLAFEGGWSSVKLYFMMGLPTETDEDILGIAELASKVVQTWKRYAANKSRGVRVTVSASCFVPKPHTPFQWEAQNTVEEFTRKQELLKNAMKRSVTYNWHDAGTSFLEGILARGDRRLSGVIEEAYKNGAKFDGWSEYFSLDTWLGALEKHGLPPEFYASRHRDTDEILPWGHISAGVNDKYLKAERERSREPVTTPDCRKCTGCGACGIIV